MRISRGFGLLALFATGFTLGGPAQGASTGSLPSGDSNLFIQLAKKTVPSVVNISTLSTVKSPYQQWGGEDDPFRRFFEDFLRRRGQGMPGDDEDGGGHVPPRQPPRRPAPKAMSLGTGFIIDASGLILTNNHVVAGADEIKITFTEESDEKPTDGEVVGRDPDLDIALIKVKSKRAMVPLSLGDSDELEVGEYVMAVGNPFGQGHSVTHGIVSAKGRVAPEFVLARYIQTDAPINPGNSGGPLVNLKGEVIGINNAIDARAQGIGFAIPINLVKQVLSQLKSKGTVARGYIGVEVGELTPEIAAKIGVSKELRAPFVTNVMPGEPAEKAGIKPYDVILEVNGKAIHSTADLIMEVTALKVGDTVPVKVSRGGETKEYKLRISQRPGADAFKRGEHKQRPKQKKPSSVDTGLELEDMNAEIARDLGLQPDAKGVVVNNVAYGSPADQAGVLRGDVILEVDRKSVKDVESFHKLVDEKKSYLLRVRRLSPQGGEVFQVIVLDLKE